MENLKIVANFLCEAVNVGFDIKEGKSYAEIARLMDESIALAQVDWKIIPEEAKNYDSEDLANLVRSKLDLKDDELEMKIEDVVYATLKIGEIGLSLYDVFKK